MFKRGACILTAILVGCAVACWGESGETAVSLEEQVVALEKKLEAAGSISIEPFLGTWEGQRADGSTVTLLVSAYDEAHADIRIDIYDVDGELYATSPGIAQALPLGHMFILLAETDYSMVWVLGLQDDGSLRDTGMVEWDAGALAYAHDPEGTVVLNRTEAAD